MILTIILIIAVVALGSKILSGIFSLLGKIIKIGLGIALALTMFGIVCRDHTKEMKLISGLQNKEVRDEFVEYCKPHFKAALEAECQSMTGSSTEELRKVTKEVIDFGKQDAETIKSSWEEEYANDITKEIKKEVVEETVETSDVEPGFHFETTTTTLPSSNPGFHFER